MLNSCVWKKKKLNVSHEISAINNSTCTIVRPPPIEGTDYNGGCYILFRLPQNTLLNDVTAYLNFV